MQTVSLGSVNSDIQTVCCGVPQGSVLGPLLFLIYINDFHNCSELLDFHLFADDANLFFKHKDINLLESEINSELANVHIWLSANKLSLNIGLLILIKIIVQFFERKIPERALTGAISIYRRFLKVSHRFEAKMSGLSLLATFTFSVFTV